MPGLRQLKQFSSDLLAVGNEVSIRATRGEKPVKIPIPSDITIEDDSEDFVLGMPENEAVIEAAPAVDEDLSDLTGLGTPQTQNESDSAVDPSLVAPDLSSLLNPINVSDDSSADAEMPDLSMFMDEEEVVEEEPQEPEEISIADMGLDALLAGGGFDQPEESFEENNFDDLDSNISDDVDDLGPLEEFDQPADVDPLADMDPEIAAIFKEAGVEDSKVEEPQEVLDSFDDLPEMSFDETPATPADDFDLGDLNIDAEPAAAEENIEDAADGFDLSDLDIGDNGDAADSFEEPADDVTDAVADDNAADVADGFDLGDLNFDETPAAPADDFDLGDMDFDAEPAAAEENIEDATDGFDLSDLDTGSEETAGLDDMSTDGLDDFASDASGADGFDLGDLGDISTDGLDDMSMESLDVPEDSGVGEENFDDVHSDFEAGDLGDISTDGLDDFGDAADGFDLSDLDAGDNGDAADGFEESADGETSDFADSFDAGDLGDFSTDGLDDFTSDLGSSDSNSIDDFSVPDDFSSDTFGGDDFTGDFDSDAGDNVDFEDSISEETPEVFDVSEMGDMDFDMPETDAQMESGFDLGNSDDFAMEGDFEIPGFSDVETIKEEKKSSGLVTSKDKKGRKNKNSDLDEPDFSEAMESEELPPNTLSDAQYKVFLKNLSEYPLNVRLAVEDLLVKDEFTEDAEFEIIEKILNKIPARQLAGTLEKMLDTSIPVPRDYEHRTAEEYEAYKKSLSYQLRNKIIPGAIAAVGVLIVAWGLFNFGKNCIYKPLKASSLYKQGYTLLQENEYPQSEMKFNEATKYRLNKKWFFEYARGYREHKQYQRAGSMYQNILYCFKHDKAAGLEYAAMELEDLANYERAEEIVKREVLDYHINDSDGILLLGDTYLEWGTEKDPEKLEMARQQYATLIQLYKPNDLYVSRMMRYFIRSDKLLSVLQIKDNFQKDKQLVPEDWTELSGYLLEKYYGPLAPADEYLRYQIEGLRGLLLKATKNDNNNPVAFYNLGRYYVLSNEMAGIESTMQKAIKKFNTSESLKRRDIYKYIDSYRLLGEYYTEKTDYLQAQEQFTEGISLYTTERDNAGFEGNAQVGKLFEDLANIKYFVSGDYDEALLNYKNSVELNNDTPAIRYKIGYIQYQNKNYIEALGSFMKAGDGNVKEENLMLAMANTLSLRGDDYAAQGYYDRLINKMDLEIAEKGLVLPQKNLGDLDLVTQYLYAANNYGVTLYRLAKRTGNSGLNAQAIVQFQQSVRAWDALTRNQSTLVRLGGSNLAEQNIQYITHRLPEFEPSIYINIPNVLTDQDHL